PDPELLAMPPAERKPDAPASASPRPPKAPHPAAVAMNPGPASTSAAEQPGPTERPPSESGTGTLLTAPNTPAEKFREVLDPGLPTPLRFRFRELEQEKRRLQEELQKDQAYRLELACGETKRAFPRLQEAFQVGGIRLVIDQGAQDYLTVALKKDYVVYCE